MSRRASYTTTKRRASVTLITASHNSEEDITKTILSVKKAPSSISKRRGSAVSISDSLNSNSRNNSIVMIEEQANSLLPNLKPLITQTTTAATGPVIILEDETKISLDQMDTGEFIRPDYELTMPPPILQHKWGENGESCHNYYEDEDDDDDDDYDEEDVLLPLPENNVNARPTSKSQSHKKSLSAPIPCLAHDRPLVPSINYDNHTQYKQRAQMSSKKLTNFFGDKPPIDISIREIEKEGLKAMLQSKIPLCYFLYSLLEEYSCENLFFFLEVERYESHTYPNASQRLVAAQRIFDTYLTRNSQFEVNIDDKVRKSVVSAIKSPRDPTHCFDEAKRAIFVLLEVGFARFIRSETAEMMKRDISENTTQYSVKARNAAVSLLFRFLERHGCSDIKQQDLLILVGDHSEKDKSLSVNGSLPIPSPTSTTSQRRYELVRLMTLTFLRTIVGIDMENYQHYISRKRSNERINEKNSEEEYEWDDALGHQQRRKNPFRRHGSKNSLKIK